MLVSATVFASASDDTLWSKNSLRLEIGGKAIFGVGCTFERTWRNPNKTKHPRAFNSVDVNVSYAPIEYVLASITINRNWYLGAKKKWTVNCGITPTAFINVDPTPKWLRDYYDSIQFYGGWYTNPVEPWLLGNISCRYTFNRVFVQVSYTPFIYSYKVQKRESYLVPLWGGVSVGMKFKHRKPKSEIKEEPEEDFEEQLNNP